MTIRGVGILLGMAAFGGVIFCIFDRHWRVSVNYNTPGSAMPTVSYHEGLWHRCSNSYNLGGQSNCAKMMEAINHLPGELIIQRGLAVFAAIAGGIGVLFGMASAQRINFAAKQKDKNCCATLAGVCYVVTAICIMAAASWSASHTLKDSKWDYGIVNTAGYNIIYTIGADIYIGWVTGVTALIAGCIMIFTSCKNDEYDDDEMEYNTTQYAPPNTYNSSGNKEYC